MAQVPGQMLAPWGLATAKLLPSFTSGGSSSSTALRGQQQADSDLVESLRSTASRPTCAVSICQATAVLGAFGIAVRHLQRRSAVQSPGLSRGRAGVLCLKASETEESGDTRSEEETLWKTAYETEDQRLMELVSLVRGKDGSKKEKAAREKAIGAAMFAADAGRAMVMVRPTVESWRKAYEKLRDANATLERVDLPKAKKPQKPKQQAKEEAARAVMNKALNELYGDKERGPGGMPVLKRSLKPKVVGITAMGEISASSEQLAQVGQLREMLGSGTIPLLAALFGEAASLQEMPRLEDVRMAMSLAATPFRASATLDLGRCLVVRGELSEAGEGASAASTAELLADIQARLDDRFGQGLLTAFLQRERYPVSPGFGAVLAKEDRYDSFAVRDQNSPSSTEPQKAALLVFLSSDLPLGDDPPGWRFPAVLFSLSAAVLFCNAVALSAKVLDQQQIAPSGTGYYLESLGVSLRELDVGALLPVGLALLLVVAAQEIGRRVAAERHLKNSSAELRPGFFLPWPVLGCLGSTWDVKGLLPSRTAQVEITAWSRGAAIAVAAVLCVVGLLRTAAGPEAEAMLRCDPKLLPLIVLQAIGGSYPEDTQLKVIGLGDAVATSQGAAGFVGVDPLLLAGGLALTSQALGLLPLRGLDGHILARFVLGPKTARAVELTTFVLLLLGAFGRLGPNADVNVCYAAIVFWAASALSATGSSQMPPREDFEDASTRSAQAAAAAALLLVPAVILIAGRLVPYGIVTASSF
eukprot:TRINITY_DN8713_c0_g1_i1.p1 TRINITY_DN8713_c0_g1~~TRINITY_DN8713_c0_g1_i1.p1  ORF type:complete len:757 (+),score=180.29 TRINITY_DN8713_c0_g1_i1:43-2313(+)